MPSMNTAELCIFHKSLNVATNHCRVCMSSVTALRKGEVMASYVLVLNKLFKRKSGADFHKQ